MSLSQFDLAPMPKTALVTDKKPGRPSVLASLKPSQIAWLADAVGGGIPVAIIARHLEVSERSVARIISKAKGLT